MLAFLLELVLAVVANVVGGLVLYFICKWLDSENKR